jgi:hypothetical protein
MNQWRVIDSLSAARPAALPQRAEKTVEMGFFSTSLLD